MQQSTHMHDNSFDHFISSMSLPNESVFIADIDLWPIYLGSFASGPERQYHNCHACRQFIQKYGNLVTVNPKTGETNSAVWGIEVAPSGYEKAMIAMKNAVEKATISKVFISSDKILGSPVTGEWKHFASKNPKVYVKRFLTAGQMAAEKKEDYRNVSRALGEFKIETLEQVTELLQSDSLYRSEKVLGQAKWLYELKVSSKSEKHQQLRKNIIWKAVSDAPAGFCHPRSSMIGTILDDLQSGLSFDDAARRFKEKMHPLQYQRPQAAPSSGAILAAERMVKELGVEPSLERQYATLSDVQTLWKPAESDGIKSGGVFDHLKKDAKSIVAAVAGQITWLKFAADVLPKARSIEVYVPNGRSAFTTFVTAKDNDAPIIFQWGNPVSWYHWNGGSTPEDYGISGGWSKVDAVCLSPYMWGEKNLTHYKNDASFIIRGARETKNQGNAIFPETLKSEFHGIRSVIEAHSRQAKIHDIEGSHVVGKGIGSKVRVHTSVITEYTIDRWD